jgi:hypothetical protein
MSDKDLVHFDDKMIIEAQQRDERLTQIQAQANQAQGISNGGPGSQYPPALQQ